MPELTDAQKHLAITSAFKARDRAYSPYSKFRVGAALLTPDGEVILGCNVENASYGGTICAERTAIVKAVSEGHKKFIGLAVCTDVPSSAISPCGICRQVLREFCPLNMPVYLVSSTYERIEQIKDEKVVLVRTIEELLPMSFGPEQLELERA